MLRAFVSLALLVGLSLFAGPLRAGPIESDKGILHRVADEKETYAALADHYYGKRFLERHLRMFNRREEPLRRGTTLIIPTYRLVVLQRGQSLEQFAREHLQDPGRAEYLAALHDPKKKGIKPGRRLRVMQSLPHAVRPGETLEAIARTYYRDAGARRVHLLELFNKTEARRVRPGTSIRIPMDTPEFNRDSVSRRARTPMSATSSLELAAAATLEQKADAPPPERSRKRKKARPQSPAPSGPRVEDRLEIAERLYDDGEYSACAKLAKETLEKAEDAPVLPRLEVLRLKASSEIALGQPEAAKATFRALLALDPKYELDLYRTSPKILGLFQAVAER